VQVGRLRRRQLFSARRLRPRPICASRSNASCLYCCARGDAFTPAPVGTAPPATWTSAFSLRSNPHSAGTAQAVGHSAGTAQEARLIDGTRLSGVCVSRARGEALAAIASPPSLLSLCNVVETIGSPRMAGKGAGRGLASCARVVLRFLSCGVGSLGRWFTSTRYSISQEGRSRSGKPLSAARMTSSSEGVDSSLRSLHVDSSRRDKARRGSPLVSAVCRTLQRAA